MTNKTRKDNVANDINSILPLLVCPECHADLTHRGTSLKCQGCARDYEIKAGIPRLGQVGSSEKWGMASDDRTSVDYQDKFQKQDIGERYKQRYQKHWSKRRVTRREIKRLEQLLASQSRCRYMLDLPCGGGRVSAPLADATDCLLQADIGLSQILAARQIMTSKDHTAWLTASAFSIPLKDNAVDATVCNRLTHHLPSSAEKERLIQELLRVSSRFVILSYYDHNSFKSLGRRLRGKHPGHTLSRPNLRALAERHEARVQIDVPLWYIGSRLRYVLLQKRRTVSSLIIH